MEPSKEPRDVVSEYAEYGSEVYAPLTRNGLITRDKMAHLYETRPAQLESLDGLLEMEVSLPKRLQPPHPDRCASCTTLIAPPAPAQTVNNNDDARNNGVNPSSSGNRRRAGQS